MDINEETKTSKTKAQNVNVNLKCRFYEKEFPEVDELVMVEIRDLVENGAYAKLLEYNDKEGMIAPNEFTAARMKSINKIFKVGTQEVVMVLRVDTEKGYIDLSKKKVNVTDINQCKEKFRQGKLVHTILATIAAKNNIDLEKLYQDIAWPLAKKFGSAYDALRNAVLESDKIFKEINITDDLKTKLLSEIKRRLAPQPVKIRADFEMTCFSYEGIDGIKSALREGKTKSTSSVDLQFQVLSAPVYMAIANTPDKNEGIKIMKEALALIEIKIKEKKGSFLMKEEPRVIGDKGEKEIEQLVQQLEKGKEVVDSDDEDNDEAMNVDVDGVDDDDEKKKGDDDDDDDEDDEEEGDDDKKEK